MNNEQMTLERARRNAERWAKNEFGNLTGLQVETLETLLAHTVQPAEVDEAKEREAFRLAMCTHPNVPFDLERDIELNGWFQIWLSAKRHAASVAAQPCPYVVTSPGGSSFCRLAESAQQPASAQAEPQHTICAGCGIDKPTPLRVDSMGGYVCLTCIDKKLHENPPPATSREVPENLQLFGSKVVALADKYADNSIHKYQLANEVEKLAVNMFFAAPAAPKEAKP